MPPSPTRAWLLSLEQIGIKLGLEQIRALVDALGHPDAAFRSIIIAGTNGKGSVTAMLERALRSAGYRTGRYTSPHLVHLEERFAVDGSAIAPDVLDDAAGRIRDASAGLPAPPSFFEATTALAFEVFRRSGVEVALLEVGLGGRLDATNVTAPIAAVITQVDFDHEQYLGDTLEAIAAEKAGVIKPGMLVVVGDNPRAVEEVVTSTCALRGATCVRAGDGTTATWTMVAGLTHLSLATSRRRYETLCLALRGRHQIANATAALRLLEELDARGMLAVPADSIRVGLEDVEWPARLELISTEAGEVLLDGAHNPAGARALASYLGETFGRRLPILLGVMRDKHTRGIIEALAPAASDFVFTAAGSPRAADPAALADLASHVAPSIRRIVEPSPAAALARVQALGSPAIVAGSLYLAGEIRAILS